MEQMFSHRLRQVLSTVLGHPEQLQEIRLRAGQPLLIRYKNRECGVDPGGRLTERMTDAFKATARDVKETLDCLCQYSLYAYADEMRQGFLTVKGGHRIGIAGQVVIEEGQIKSIRYVSSLNIRIAHQIPGCGAKVLPRLFNENGLCHTLIIAPPGCGKTTILRDIVRLLSWGGQLEGVGRIPGMTVGVVDERSEIGACYQGLPQNDLGPRTDVMDNCPKVVGMMRLVRTMAPQVIAVDEIGGEGDMAAVEEAMNCGCRMIATIHGRNMEEVRKRLGMEAGQEMPFEKYVLLPDNKEFDRAPQVMTEEGRSRISGRYLCG